MVIIIVMIIMIMITIIIKVGGGWLLWAPRRLPKAAEVSSAWRVARRA